MSLIKVLAFEFVPLLLALKFVISGARRSKVLLMLPLIGVLVRESGLDLARQRNKVTSWMGSARLRNKAFRSENRDNFPMPA